LGCASSASAWSIDFAAPGLAAARGDSSGGVKLEALPTAVGSLLAEALAHNPEIAGARAESEAAQQRVRPAGALDDPMLETGIVNAPLPLNLHQDDMTMAMLGLSQKLPFPGKRDLRRDVASASAASVALAVGETINRVARDLRVAYEELSLAETSERIVGQTRETLRQLAAIAQARYSVGLSAQSDALQAQTQLVRLQEQLLRIGQDEVTRRTELQRLLGRQAGTTPVHGSPATLLALRADPDVLTRQAMEQRPQLQALDALVDKSDRQVELARREYYPDFNVRFGYGYRAPTPDGMSRDPMVTLTVEINLPIWRKSRLGPMVAEAQAMREQAARLAETQRLETQTMLEQQLAAERQLRESAALYRSTLLPQAHASVESALTAYRLGRVDFLTLLEAQMREYETSMGEAETLASHNKAVAEIDFLTGYMPDVSQVAQP
jgi:outer membrane protein TolC